MSGTSKTGGFRYQAYKLMQVIAVKPCAPLQINDGNVSAAMQVIGWGQGCFYMAFLFRNTKFEDKVSPKASDGPNNDQHRDERNSINDELAKAVSQDDWLPINTKIRPSSWRALETRSCNHFLPPSKSNVSMLNRNRVGLTASSITKPHRGASIHMRQTVGQTRLSKRPSVG